MVIVGGESNGVMSSDIWVFGFCKYQGPLTFIGQTKNLKTL